jgi:hypothetical protein
MDYLYTKVIVILTAILFFIYIYARYIDKYSVIYYERKVNNFYYTHKLAIFLFFMLLIIGYVFYRIEKSNIKDKKIINSYALMIDILQTKINKKDIDVTEEQRNEIRERLEPKLKEVYNQKILTRQCNINNKGLQECKITFKNDFDYEKAINDEIRFLEYNTPNNALRFALKNEEWKLAIDIMLDDLQNLFPSITKEQIGVALSKAVIAGFRNQHPAFGLGYLVTSK